LARAWGDWFWTGKVPRTKTPNFDSEDFETFNWDQATVRYSGHRLLLRQDDFHNWLQPWLNEFNNNKSGIPKSGAPGRPSSMGIVLTEFDRRRQAGACEGSRVAEADALAQWLKVFHLRQSRSLCA
jgi:hypothetical protein